MGLFDLLKKLFVRTPPPLRTSKTRRRLRAIRHHLAAGRPATLTAEQLAGWDALQHMIDTQSQKP